MDDQPSMSESSSDDDFARDVMMSLFYWDDLFGLECPSYSFGFYSSDTTLLFSEEHSCSTDESEPCRESDYDDSSVISID